MDRDKQLGIFQIIVRQTSPRNQSVLHKSSRREINDTVANEVALIDPCPISPESHRQDRRDIPLGFTKSSA